MIDGTAKNGKTKKEEEKGLYLQDLGSDPSKLEKYFGKRSGAMRLVEKSWGNFLCLEF